MDKQHLILGLLPYCVQGRCAGWGVSCFKIYTENMETFNISFVHADKQSLS